MVISEFDITFIDVLRLLIIPVLLPALVGAVSRVTTWPAFVKRFSLAFLALASNVGLEFLAASDSGQAYNLWWALFLGVIAYAVAELTFQGFYKAPLSKPIDVGTYTGSSPVDISSLPPKTLAGVIAGKN